MARLDTPRTLRDRLYKTFRTRAPATAERMTGLSRPDVDDDGVPLAEEDVGLRNRRLEALVTGRVIGNAGGKPGSDPTFALCPARFRRCSGSRRTLQGGRQTRKT